MRVETPSPAMTTSDFFLQFSSYGIVAVSTATQRPGAFVFSDFYHKLLLMSIITVYANLFSLEIKGGPLTLLLMPLSPRRGIGQ